ncbi:MAG: cell envelope biogenesis protein TolA [Alphaproteobacteria bacterium]|nr:cell envelope biogenesis protein TolA [Alphaproteobacteria bacterium]
MKLSATEPGILVSGLAHGAILLVSLVAFSSPPPLQDLEESVPVEIITSSQLNEIMKGEKTATKPADKPQIVEKVAEITEPKPEPKKVEAKVDIAAPPPPKEKAPEPEPPTPLPPQRVAALEPKPEPPKPEPPKVEPVKPEPAKAKAEDKPKAEAIEPAKPVPPPRPKAEDKPKPPEKPQPPEKPKAEDKPKPDALAKLIDAKKTPDPPKPPAKPKTSEQTSETQRKFDVARLKEVLSKEDPQQKAATGAQLNQTASIGSPTANAARMSPSLSAKLDGFLKERYAECWGDSSLWLGLRYVPQIKVHFTREGILGATPELRNAPTDPKLRSLAESAMRAVRKCNPMPIPVEFMPYYDEWKDQLLRFNPEDMAG